MEDAISHGLSSLLPLLGLLAVIGGGLITLALVLRFRIRRDTDSQSVSVTSVTNVKKNDLMSVLGRTFTVRDVCCGNQSENQSKKQSKKGLIWIHLSSDDTDARVAFLKKEGLTLSFPGKAQPSTQNDFPATLHMWGKDYEKTDHLKDATELEVALYSAGDSGFWLALERRREYMVAWRGKQVPSEGVTVLQD